MCTMATVVQNVTSESIFYTSLRRVKFDLQSIIIFIDDNEDRKGPWELFAVDRDRFKHRIVDVEKKIGWCFKPEHRNKVFNRLPKPS